MPVPTVKNPTIYEITQTTAKFKCEISNALAIYYAVYLAQDPTPSAANIKRGAGAIYSAGFGVAIYGTSVSGNLSKLTPNTKYKAYFVAANSSGDSNVASAPFATLATVGAPIISNLYMYGIEQTKANYCYDINADATVYMAVYSASVLTPSVSTIKSGTGAVYSSNYTIKARQYQSGGVSRLTPNTQYKIYFVATNAGGDSNVASVAFTTLAAVGAPIISNLYMYGVEQTKANYCYDINADATVYLAVYSASVLAPSVSTIKSGTGAVYSSNNTIKARQYQSGGVSQLTPNTQYKIYFVATNAGGDSNIASVAFTTLAAVGAPVISNLYMYGIEQTKANYCYDINADATVYKAVYLAKLPAPSVSTIKTGTGAVYYSNSFVQARQYQSGGISQLTPNTQYKIYFVATNAGGDSNIASVAFTTLAAIGAPVISNLYMYGIEQTKANYCYDINADATVYKAVYLAKLPAPSVSTIKTGTGAVYFSSSFVQARQYQSGGVSQLTSNTQYKIYFVATNAGGDSNVASVAFSTLV